MSAAPESICALTVASRPPYAELHQHERCRGVDHLREKLSRVEALGGEGLMLRQPGSRYEAGRSPTLLKVKTFHDAEARVVEHFPGTGRHKGRLGALAVELPDGTTFSIGTGFSDAQREQPPAIGSVVTFRYQELSDRGVPRFPSFVRVCHDAAAREPPPEVRPTKTKRGRAPLAKETSPAPKQAPAEARYFEFIEAVPRSSGRFRLMAMKSRSGFAGLAPTASDRPSRWLTLKRQPGTLKNSFAKRPTKVTWFCRDSGPKLA